MNIEVVQKYMSENNIDAWLMADFHGRNNIAMEFLNITGMISRRWFYFLPEEGKPTLFHSPIEKDKFEHIDANLVAYSGYKELEDLLESKLYGYKRVAMEYSPMGRLPYIALVDAGTVELILSFGCDVISSADMVADFKARLSKTKRDYHRKAADKVIEIMNSAHSYIVESLKNNMTVAEYDVSRHIKEQLENNNMFADHDPNCSVNANAGNPHYEPTKEASLEIKRGDLILIDLWGRSKDADGVYADITWMAFAGTKEEIPDKYRDIFQTVINARDKAVEYLKENIGKQVVYGADVDDACRQVFIDAGLHEHFTHRTGHSITSNVHGDGPGIDNLESEDKRILQTGHLFSIEPGLYFEDCGFRSEINCLVTEEGLEITTTPLQTEIKPLF